TVAGAVGALPGTGAATVKVTPYLEYPAKGRATGGGGGHRCLKGGDGPGLARGGAGPARGGPDARGAGGAPPPAPRPAGPRGAGRRGGSGVRVRQPLTALGGLAP